MVADKITCDIIIVEVCSIHTILARDGACVCGPTFGLLRILRVLLSNVFSSLTKLPS